LLDKVIKFKKKGASKMFGVEEDVYPSLWSLKINGQVDTLICQTTWSVPSSSPNLSNRPPISAS